MTYEQLVVWPLCAVFIAGAFVCFVQMFRGRWML